MYCIISIGISQQIKQKSITTNQLMPGIQGSMRPPIGRNTLNSEYNPMKCFPIRIYLDFILKAIHSYHSCPEVSSLHSFARHPPRVWIKILLLSTFSGHLLGIGIENNSNTSSVSGVSALNNKIIVKTFGNLLCISWGSLLKDWNCV